MGVSLIILVICDNSFIYNFGFCIPVKPVPLIALAHIGVPIAVACLRETAKIFRVLAKCHDAKHKVVHRGDP